MVPKKFTECDKIKPVQFKTAVVALFREMIHKRQQKEKKKKNGYEVPTYRFPKPIEDVSNYPDNLIHILGNDEAR